MDTTFFIVLCIVVIIGILWLIFWKNPRKSRLSQRTSYNLTRSVQNPLITPRPNQDWEAEGTFNPGAVTDRNGLIHLFYRAIGRDGVSRIGHATTTNGIGLQNRSAYPVYQPVKGYGLANAGETGGPAVYDPLIYVSGGGWAGAEDPRAVRLGNRVYLTYTAFAGWDNMRIAVTSIALDDLEKGRFDWRRPRLISPAGHRAKNWVFFPEKIGGRYAILHGLAPKIMVAYVDSPEIAPPIESVPDNHGGGYFDPRRLGKWDNWVRGAGAPPIKTNLGWLLLYHAIDKRNPARVVGYNVGAMILDLSDPTKILYRSPEPILTPDKLADREGKPGVVYASGAVVKGDKLLVYYGSGDKNTCVAETSLPALLDWLKRYGQVF